MEELWLIQQSNIKDYNNLHDQDYKEQEELEKKIINRRNKLAAEMKLVRAEIRKDV